MSRSPEYWVHHMGSKRPVSRPAVSARRRTYIIERAGSAAAGDVAVPDFVRRAAGSPQAAAFPVQCHTASDAVV